MAKNKDLNEKPQKEIVVKEAEMPDLFEQPEIKLKEEKEKEIFDYIFDTLEKAVSDHDSGVVSQIKKYQDLYYRREKTKNWPWSSCSNVSSPIPALTVDGIESRLMRVMWETGQVAIATVPSWVKKEEMRNLPDVERLVDDLVRIKLNGKKIFRKITHKALIERCAIGKLRWLRIPEQVRDIEEFDNIKDFKAEFPSAKEAKVEESIYNEYVKTLEANAFDDQGKLVSGEQVRIPVRYEDTKSGPRLDIVSREDFIVPKDTLDPMDRLNCEFNAQRIKDVRWEEIATKEQAGIYRTKQVDKLREKVDAKYKDNEKKIGKGYKTERYELYECIWSLCIDPEKSELEQDYIITLDLKNRVWLNIEPYKYRHGRRYFIPFRTMEGETWDGVAIPEKLEQEAKQDKTYRDVTIDAETLANMPVIKAKMGTVEELDSYEWYPGSVWFTKDPQNDLIQFQVTANTQALRAERQEVSAEAQMLGRVTSYNSGQAMQGDKNAPAKKTMALLQESNIGINDYKDVFQDGFDELCQQLLGLYYERADDEEIENIGVKDRKLLQDRRITFRIRGTTISANKDIQRQDAVFAFNLLGKHPLVQRSLLFQRNLAADVLTSMEKDPNRYMPSEDDLKREEIKAAVMKREQELEMEMMKEKQATDAAKRGPEVRGLPQPPQQPMPGNPVMPTQPPPNQGGM